MRAFIIYPHITNTKQLIESHTGFLAVAITGNPLVFSLYLQCSVDPSMFI